MERKKKLIDALIKERELFKERGQSTLNHDCAIEFLETGKTDKNPEDFDLLDAAMNDFDCLCSDYEV